MGESSKSTLHRYLQTGREAIVWKLEGLDEYDVRRPMTPTGTNLLGLVKHLASVELGYFVECFDKPHDVSATWSEDEPNSDMFARADESRDQVIQTYRSVWLLADETIERLPLEAKATVPWWSEDARHPDLQWLLVHVATETHRHAGHADIIRELIDGAAGFREGNDNLGRPTDSWSAYHARLEQIARDVAERPSSA